MPGPASYHLSRHAFVCKAGRYYVFLDLARDLYFSIPREDLDELVPWIQGAALDSRMELHADTPLSAAATALATELVAAGVLREEPPEEQPAAPLTPTPVCDLTSSQGSLHPTRSRRRLLMSVAASMAYARWALGSKAMYSIVEAVAERKRASTVRTEDWGRAAELTEVFLHYRPLFPWDYRCLFDSLALIQFLSRFNLYPDWVFGIQDDPFCAHCWVQAGTRILNDDFEHVRSYTPIMAV